MATGYHLNVKNVSTGNYKNSTKTRKSIIDKAAYNARAQLHDEKENRLTKNYGKDGEHSPIELSALFIPPNAPGERGQLWNAVNSNETRKNARFAKEFEVAFAWQLNQQQRKWLITDFARENFLRRGYAADVNIHAPHLGDDRNWHAHILVPDRAFGPDGKFVEKKKREWDTPQQIRAMREDWADRSANMLDRAGFPLEAEQWRSGHLRLGPQREAAIERGDYDFAAGLNVEAGKHRGPDVARMEAKGINTDRGEIASAIEARNTPEAIAKNWEQIARPEIGPRADLWAAREVADNPQAFQSALGERGFWLARVSEKDAEQGRIVDTHREHNGRHVAHHEPGDYVAINNHGHTFGLNCFTTGKSKDDMTGFLAPLDAQPMQDIATTRAEFKTPLFNRHIETPAEKLAPRENENTVRATNELVDLGAVGIDKGIDGAAAALDCVIDGGAALLDVVLGGLVAAPTPERTRAENRAQVQAAAQREAEEFDVNRALKDAEYLENATRKHDEQKRQEQSREDYKRYYERDR